MKYYRVLACIEMVNAEKTLNAFVTEIEDKGHRILHSSFKMFGSWMSEIYTSRRYEAPILFSVWARGDYQSSFQLENKLSAMRYAIHDV